jgi:hypothetical protein
MSVHGRSRRRIFVRQVVATAVAITALTAETGPADAAVSRATPGPVAGHVLGGVTSQGWPVVITVSSNGMWFAREVLALEMSCTSGTTFTAPAAGGSVVIGSNGWVSAAGTIPGSSASAGSGVTLTGGSESFTGRLNRKRGTFSGTWHMHLTMAMQGGQTDECDSGQVSFTARL